jgi:Domain of unknown function DUF11
VEIDHTVILSGTELSLTQIDTPDPVNVVNPLSDSLTVINDGPDDTTGVTVADIIPAGTAYQSVSATEGSCSELAGTVTCVSGNMMATGSAMINIAPTAAFTTGTNRNSATVSGNETDPFPANNASIEYTTVQILNVNQLCFLVAGSNNMFTGIEPNSGNVITTVNIVPVGSPGLLVAKASTVMEIPSMAVPIRKRFRVVRFVISLKRPITARVARTPTRSLSGMRSRPVRHCGYSISAA